MCTTAYAIRECFRVSIHPKRIAKPKLHQAAESIVVAKLSQTIILSLTGFGKGLSKLTDEKVLHGYSGVFQ